MTPSRFRKLVVTLNLRQPDLTVVMEGVHKPHNLSAVVRSCDAVGVSEVHATSTERQVRLAQKTAGGNRRWIPVTTHSSIAVAYEKLRTTGFNIIAAHAGAEAAEFRSVDYTKKIALVFGGERKGLSTPAMAGADHCITIPTQGMAGSLNVSVAAALILYEAQRQRQLAGFYEKRRLTDVVYNRTLFEWLHPDVAEYCRKHKRDYPKINNHGELIDFTMVS